MERCVIFFGRTMKKVWRSRQRYTAIHVLVGNTVPLMIVFFDAFFLEMGASPVSLLRHFNLRDGPVDLFRCAHL